MATAEQLITKNLDIWTSTVKVKSSRGRGSNKNLKLYGISKLRELILQLAVMGKLVPQEPEDEPAAELLKNVADEKERLIRDKKIKKQKPLPATTKEEQPYPLPIRWEWEKMGNLSTQITDGTHHTPEYIDAGVPFISVKDIDGRGISFEDCKYISQEQHEEINTRCNPQPGDILICRIGTLGRATIVNTEYPFSLFVSVGLIKFLQHHYIPRFAHLALHSPLLLKQYEKIKAGGSHTNKLNLRDIPKLLLPVAPLPEQHRIVAKVDELMALCDQLEQEQENNLETHENLVSTLLNALTSSTADSSEFAEAWQRIQANFDILFTTESSVDQLKKTILQLAVMGKLVPQEPEDEPAAELLKNVADEKERLIRDKKIKKQKPLPATTKEEQPYPLPIRWEWEKMGNLSTQITDGTHHTPEYINAGVPFISVKDIDGRGISFEDCKYISQEQHEEINTRCNPQPGDILICRIGTLGRATIVNTEYPFSLFVSVGLIKFLQHHYIPRFAHLALHSPLLLKQYEKIKAGGSHTNKLNLRDIPKLLLPVAPLPEQHRIVAKVDELMALCDQIQASLASAQETQLNLAESLVEQAVHSPA